MPHRVDHVQGQGRYGFGTGMPEDVFGAFSNVAPSVRPEYNEEQFRAAMGFVPVAGTAYNWNQMGPWGRAGSVGLDALDVLTAGGGKLPGAALRGLMKLAQRNPLNPKLISFRAGLPPVDEFGNYTVSTSNLTGEPLEGVSAFQGAQFPFGRGTVIRPAINEYKTYTHLADPELTLPLSSPLRSLKSGEQYRLNPLHTQYGFLKQRPEEMYRITGDVMPGVKGGDLESLLAASTISTSGVTRMPFSEFKHITGPFSGLDDYTKAVNQFTGMPFASPRMTKKALNLFSKHDPQGTPLPITPNAIDQWLARANLASTIPATVPARGVNYTWDTPGIFGGASPTNRGNLSPGG